MPIAAEQSQKAVTAFGFYAAANPANTGRSTNAGLMLAHRLRRWANIKPALVYRPLFAGLNC